MSGPEDNVVTEHHSERELQILDKFYSRLKKKDLLIIKLVLIIVV